MLARDATVSQKFLSIRWNIWFFDETNGQLKKVIPFCVLNMFHFVIICGFGLKIAYFLNKTTIFYQIRLLAWKFTKVQDQPYLFTNINLKKTIKTVEVG